MDRASEEERIYQCLTCLFTEICSLDENAEDERGLCKGYRVNKSIARSMANASRNIPTITIIDGYEIRQTENYHVTIVRLSDQKKVFHAQCDKKQDAHEILDFYKEFSSSN